MFTTKILADQGYNYNNCFYPWFFNQVLNYNTILVLRYKNAYYNL